jgi:P-type Cu2+ transporter
MKDWAKIGTQTRRLDGGLSSLSCVVEGMQCSACANRIERGLAELNGVRLVRANFSRHRLRVIWDATEQNIESILDKIDGMGFRLFPIEAESAEQTGNRIFIPLAVAGFGTMNIMAFSAAVWAGLATDMGDGTRSFLYWLSAGIAIPVALYSGKVFYLPAWQALRHGRLSMDAPISLAIFATLFASLYETAMGSDHAYFDAVVSLIFLLLIGRWMDQSIRGRSGNAADNLRALTDRTVKRINAAGEFETVAIDGLVSGDILFVPAGDRVSVDGVLQDEAALLDQSFLSGESAPVSTQRGELVLSGSLNRGHPFRMMLASDARSSRLDEIADLVETAQNHKGAQQLLADRFSRAYSPVVILAAAAGYLVWRYFIGVAVSDALMIAVAVLVVTCPCAAGLATPAVVSRAVSLLLHRGVIVKNGGALEALAGVEHVIFDKTGTLTQLTPATIPESALFDEASSLALHSAHPVSQALAGHSEATALSNVLEHPGLGISDGSGRKLGSASFVGAEANDNQDPSSSWYRSADGEFLEIAMTEQPVEGARLLVDGLKERGLTVSILSGDRQAAVEVMADALGVSSYAAGVSPEDKLSEITRAAGSTLFVGDGINDAAAMSAAAVSASPGVATEISRNAADIVLATPRIDALLDALDIAKDATRLIRQNLLFAAAYNLIALPVALLNGLTPLVAAILMSSSSILVMLNAMRLRAPR